MTQVGKYWMCGECGERCPLAASPTALANPLPGLDALPSLLALPLHEYAMERSPILQLYRLCDAVEILTRFCTIVAIGEVRGLNAGQLPKAVLPELQPRIEMPTFGKWRGMLAALVRHLPLTAPLVVAELPDFVSLHLLPNLLGGDDQPAEKCLLSLRNLLAHGGAMTQAASSRYLHGESAAEFAGWASWLENLVLHLGFLSDCVLCHHTPEQTQRLTGHDRAEPMELSADLRQAVRPLAGHVLLLRRERWLDLWPLCDFGLARMTSLHGPRTSATPAPQVFVRAEKTRLLYAALGVEVPLGERRDVVAEFRDLFQFRRGRAVEITRPDFDDDIESDSNALVGRDRQLQQARAIIKECAGGVLWLTGPGGIGKSFLVAKLASGYELLRPDVPNREQSKKWCVIAWRFRASDGDRCHRHAFFRHAISRLGQWEALGRPGAVPTVETYKLQEQLAGLLDRVAELKADHPRGKPPRVLFVLDGLDEIARSDRDLAEVPFQLNRDNVLWLCVGRPEQTLNHVFRAERCTHLFPDGLERMERDDIRAMLVEGTGKLKYDLLKQDDEGTGAPVNALVDAVVSCAEGLPLYVRFVVEDVLAGHLTFDATLPGKLPRGLSAYYDDMLRRFAIGELQALLTPLVVSVVWAKAPLEEQTLLELLLRRKVLLGGGEEPAEQTLRRGLDAAAVMLRVVPLAGGGFGYEPYHLTFRDHVRADKAKIIGGQNLLARKEFCELTCDWAKLPVGHAARRYVLRHGPEHLLEEKRHDELVRLARDRDGFLLAQARELAAEPEAPLRTLMAALQGAIAQADGGLMAEFCLRHALRVQEILGESPLEALRGGSVERALGLVELMEPERRVLGLLLMLWELQECGQMEELGTVRARLLQGEMPGLSGWRGEHAEVILKHVVTKQEGLAGLCQRVLGDHWCHPAVVQTLGRIAESQAKAGDTQGARQSFTAALTTAQSISCEWMRASALGKIAESQAKAGDNQAALSTALSISREGDRAQALRQIAENQAKAGDTQGARESFTAAISSAKSVSHEGLRAQALCQIAESQAKAGDTQGARQSFTAALTPAQSICDKRDRADALRQIAESQVKAGDTQGARQSFTAALSTALSISEERWRARALGQIAESQAKAGDTQGARQSFTAALSTARSISLEGDRADALRQIAESQAKAGDNQAAFSTALSISREGHRAQALCQIAESQAKAGDTQGARQSFTAALNTARSICFEPDRSYALRQIAESQAKAGDNQAAFSTALSISREGLRAQALCQIAESQAKAGDTQGARQSFTAALSTARSISLELHRADALRQIAESQAKAGDNQAALTTAQSICDEWFCAGAFAGALRQIAESQVKAGDTAGASRSFAAALGTARSIILGRERAEALGQIAESQAKAGDTAGARESFTAAISSAQSVSHEGDRAQALCQVAESQAKAGDTQGARQSFRAALSAALSLTTTRYPVGNEKWIQLQALRRIAASQAKAGDIQGALNTALSISDGGSRAGKLCQIAENQAKAGDTQGARESFIAAISSAQSVSSECNRVNDLRSIAESQAEVGHFSGVADTVALIRIDRNRQFPWIAAALVGAAQTDAAAREQFLHLLPQCALYLDAAVTMSGHLATLFPACASAITSLVLRLPSGHLDSQTTTPNSDPARSPGGSSP